MTQAITRENKVCTKCAVSKSASDFYVDFMWLTICKLFQNQITARNQINFIFKEYL